MKQWHAVCASFAPMPAEFRKFVEEKDVPAECRDERKAANDPKRSTAIQEDLAGIRRKARFRQIYFTTKDGEIERVILPVYGKGLWSTMYGFLALDRDRTTIKSFAFYEHGETPGLGAEIDDPAWLARWPGTLARDATGALRLEVALGRAPVQGPEAAYQVDGISGATRTSQGVARLLRFWLGPDGYGPTLARLAAARPEGGGPP